MLMHSQIAHGEAPKILNGHEDTKQKTLLSDDDDLNVLFTMSLFTSIILKPKYCLNFNGSSLSLSSNCSDTSTDIHCRKSRD